MHIPWGISFYDFHPWGHYLLVKCLDVEQSASMARNAALSEQNVSSVLLGRKAELGNSPVRSLDS